ncbi:hypothetical protein [Mucilaginibacter sp. R-33]|uniref:hypothetical protein n=1 Tax=Mucilaginibacter sp. R-33 TaxID=3416711 RepID=UPI003CE8C56F
MLISVDNLELNFKQSNDGEWWTIFKLKTIRCEVIFNEKVFQNKADEDIIIDWNCVVEAIKDLINNFDTLMRKSEYALIALHQQIFDDEFLDKKGYFDFSGIEIVEYNTQGYRYAIDLCFALQSHLSFVMDDLCYYSNFKKQPHGLILSNVRRE